MGFPGLWAVGLWSFGCLPFVATGGEQRSYLAGGGNRYRSSVVMVGSLSVFLDAHRRYGLSWVVGNPSVVVWVFSVCDYWW